MANRRKLSRDQKRKKKLAERGRGHESVRPYQGNKYRSDRFVEATFAAETGIYECYIISDRQMTDQDVKRSLENLVLELQGKTSSPLPSASAQDSTEPDPEDLIVSRIKHHWRELFAEKPRHSNSDLAGVLRTILDSVRIQSSSRLGPRGYLQYLEGFLRQMGVDIRVVDGPEFDGDEDESAELSDEELLTQLGGAWIASQDPMAKKEFVAEVETLLAEGKADLVAEVCQRLMGTSDRMDFMQEIQALLQPAGSQETASHPGDGAGNELAGQTAGEPSLAQRLLSFLHGR
jgi:hypothetical protein